MWKERAEKAEAKIIELEGRLRLLTHDAAQGAAPTSDSPNGSRITNHESRATEMSPAQEDIYRYVIRRAQEDPKILQVLAARPELRVQIETPTIEADGKTLRGGLALLIHKGFFAAPKNGNSAFNELQRLGYKIAKPNVYRELGKLAELGFLTNEDSGYQATDLKVTVAK